MPKKTFESAEQSAKKVLVQLKDNQKTLKENCEEVIRFAKSVDTFEEVEKNKNRIETRKVSTFTDTLNFIVDGDWKKYIKTIVFVERETLVFDAKTKTWMPRNENSFYVANTMLTAKEAYGSVRNHWAIENSNHYVKDVSMGEDFSRIRKNPGNMAKLRSFSLNILRKNNVSNIKGELYDNSLDYYRLYSYKHFI